MLNMRFCANTVNKVRIVVSAILFFLCLLPASGQEVVVDTLPLILPHADSLVTDSLAADSVHRPRTLRPDSALIRRSGRRSRNDSLSTHRDKSAIDAEIHYKSNDSIVVMGNGTAYLHGSGEMTYKDMSLTADYMRIKMDSSTLYARGVYDSINDEWKGRPVFSDKKDKYETEEMTYNLNTQKAFIRHVVTTQGEGYVISEKTKKMEGDLLMMADGKYTTCEDHNHPHFYLALTKAKVKPGKFIATGPAYLVVGDVPLPLAIPFGFFPFTDSYSSGIIMPNFGDDSSRGLYLKGLGYYFAINDYIDLEVLGDIYTRGTWAISAKSQYRMRYKFSGNLSFSYRVDVTGEKDLPDYTQSRNMQIQWTHTQDTKSNPYSNFSASVNFSTSGYNRSNINSYYDPALNSENTKQSTVNYTQRFPDSPWSLTANASIMQRTKDSTITLNLPTLNINMASIYPFKRKKPVGKERWYEKIQMRYSANIQNSITCRENYLLHSNFLRDWQNSVKHTLPVSASFTLFKYLNVSPSVSYNERWYFRRVDQQWDDNINAVRRDTTYGFYRVWDVSTSLNISTKLYGYFIPSRKLFGDKVDRFRHVLTPSVSFTYTPDCDPIRRKINHHYYDSYLKPVVNNGDTIYETVNYNRFQGLSTPAQGSQGTLSFSLGNNLEVKVRDDKDTTGTKPYKVISLIDNLSIGGGYNFIADSMNWSNFSLSLRLKFPNNYTINLSGGFDPYMYGLTSSGTPVRINQLYWNHKRFPYFTGTSFSFSYTFNNQVVKKWFDKKDKKTDNQSDPNNPDNADPNQLGPDGQPLDPLNDPNNPRNNRNNKGSNTKDQEEDGYIKTEIPWSLQISYTVAYRPGGKFDYEKMYYKREWTNNLSIAASIGLGKGWKASTTLSYDFKAKKMSYTNINVSRDLHCWSMSASFVPFGPYKSFTFHIGVNASMLADLKYDKSSTDSTNKRVNWW